MSRRGEETLPSVLRGVHVLVVEDDDDSRDATTAILEGCGARATAVASVAEALSAVAREAPDVIVADIAMPVEDGFEMIAALRRLSADDGGLVPAIAFSSVIDPTLRDLALRSGFQDFVSKPIDVPLLLGRVAALMQRGGGDGGAAS